MSFDPYGSQDFCYHRIGTYQKNEIYHQLFYPQALSLRYTAMPMTTRNTTRILQKQKNQEDAQRLVLARKLQKNVKVVDSTPEEHRRLQRAFGKALVIAWESTSTLIRNPAILMFLIFNEKIHHHHNPWLLTKDGFSPSSFKGDLRSKEHLALYQAWRNWRAVVPRPKY